MASAVPLRKSRRVIAMTHCPAYALGRRARRLDRIVGEDPVAFELLGVLSAAPVQPELALQPLPTRMEMDCLALRARRARPRSARVLALHRRRARARAPAHSRPRSTSRRPAPGTAASGARRRRAAWR